MSKELDLGDGHHVEITVRGDDHEPAGLIEHHLTPDGQPCTGYVTFDLPVNPPDAKRPRWQVISLDPLHLAPSLLCRRCGDHGFIRDGRWVRA